MSIFVGGFDSTYSSNLYFEPLMYSVSDDNLPALPSWPQTYTAGYLTYPSVNYFQNSLYVVGGSSYSVCPPPFGGGEQSIWAMDVTQPELSWNVMNPLSQGTCRGSITFNGDLLYATTFPTINSQVQYNGLTIYSLSNQNVTHEYDNAFESGNDLALTLANSANVTVIGGRFRALEVSFSNYEKNDAGDTGFYRYISDEFPNQYFGNGAELLGVEIQ